MNEEEITILRIPQEEYRILTQEKAMDMALESEVLSPFLSPPSNVLTVNFKHSPSYKATLHLYTLTPEEIRREKARKKKKNKGKPR